MTKKKIDAPVYPDAQLIISREKFCDLLQTQIAKSEELLKVVVPVVQQQNPYYGFGSVGRGDRVVYDEDALNSFAADFTRWNDRNKAIYRTSFSEPESIYYHEYESHISSAYWGTDIIKEYKDDISRLMNHMKSDIERSDLFKCDVVEEHPVTNMIPVLQSPSEKPFKVFISHSSKDKEFVKHLVDLLEVIGVDGKDKLFCSSVPLYGIDLSGKIFQTLLSQFTNNRLFVIYIHSDNYYASPISLNEMGASWVLQTDHCSFLTKGFPFEGMKGVVNGDEIAIKVDAEDVAIRMNQLKDKLITLLGLPQLDNDKWEWKRNQFLERVN